MKQLLIDFKKVCKKNRSKIQKIIGAILVLLGLLGLIADLSVAALFWVIGFACIKSDKCVINFVGDEEPEITLELPGNREEFEKNGSYGVDQIGDRKVS